MKICFTISARSGSDSWKSWMGEAWTERQKHKLIAYFMTFSLDDGVKGQGLDKGKCFPLFVLEQDRGFGLTDKDSDSTFYFCGRRMQDGLHLFPSQAAH